jgi:hypothetical protein
MKINLWAYLKGRVELGKHGDPVDHVAFTFVAEDRLNHVPALKETERSEHVV